jgi:hypothetical protein
MDQRSQEYAVLKFLRQNAIGPQNAKRWKEIEPHLHKCGHGNYKKRKFQMIFLQDCRKNDCFIAAYQKGYYLPRTPEDFIPYVNFTANRIKAQKDNLKSARTRMRLQQEDETKRKSRKPHPRTTAKWKGAEPTTTRTPRKARSKGRSSTRS